MSDGKPVDAGSGREQRDEFGGALQHHRRSEICRDIGNANEVDRITAGLVRDTAGSSCPLSGSPRQTGAEIDGRYIPGIFQRQRYSAQPTS